jgi:hypothetical protein
MGSGKLSSNVVLRARVCPDGVGFGCFCWASGGGFGTRQ